MPSKKSAKSSKGKAPTTAKRSSSKSASKKAVKKPQTNFKAGKDL